MKEQPSKGQQRALRLKKLLERELAPKDLEEVSGGRLKDTRYCHSHRQ